ncbi:MAG: hydantoinase/oxoprolinase family protein [Chloroflexi bacterium]|nr:hydantoinase/oxoprolinase family protein [Chloroflexota bacterium]
MGTYLGVDVGGTFTDAVVVDEKGRVSVFKTPTTPANPSLGFIEGIRKCAAAFGLEVPQFLASLEKLTYGTTIATNLLLQGKGARTGLITTRGFRDTLPMARIGREYLGIDLQCDPPPLLMEPGLIMEVSERVDYAGREVIPLSTPDVEAAIEALRAKGVDGVAVCLLWSFMDPSHERRIGGMVRHALPHTYVSLSSEVAPVIGEYERTATTVMNASLGPPIQRHLEELTTRLAESGLRVPLLIMQSTGGVTPAEQAGMTPVNLINSGPAGGLIASRFLARHLGLANAICVDMGGTSFDVSLVTDGEFTASQVSRALGHNIFVPMLDISSIGAGGGSIAWLDMGTRLKVGPQSAGADPGPACYGRGGTEPTVTDADVVLGRLNPGYFLGGEMALDADKAARSIEGQIARPLGIDLVKAASGICQIVDNNMANAIRVLTIEKGYDPRDFALIAFGGAGPCHATSLARELGIGKVVIPAVATGQSAFGIVTCDIAHTLAFGAITGLDDLGAINQRLAQLRQRGAEVLHQDGISRERQELRSYVEIRYRGQAHELSIPVPNGQLTTADLEKLMAAFEERYQATYGTGTAFRMAGYEIVTFKVEAIGHTPKPAMVAHPDEGKDPAAARRVSRPVHFDSGFVDTAIYDGARLRASNVVPGPAVVEYPGTTAVIHPDQVASVDAYLNVVVTAR